MVYADANILVRYIINDDEEMASRAERAINEGVLFVLPEVFAEIVYVLTKVYGIKDSLQELLSFVTTLLRAKVHCPPQKNLGLSSIFFDWTRSALRWP